MKRNKLLKKQILCAVVAASIWGSIPMTSFAAEEHPYHPQSIIYTDSKDHGSIEGGSINVPYPEPSILLLGKGTKLTTNGTNITGDIDITADAELTINGGKISAGSTYGTIYDEDTTTTLTGSTALSSNGGTIIVNNAVINSNIISDSVMYGENSENMNRYYGTIILNNTDINTNNDYSAGAVIAGADSKIILNGNNDTTYIVGDFLGTINEFGDNGSFDINGNPIIHESGVIEINGGTLKANSLYIPYDSSIKGNISKNIILQKDGVIETKTGQIFEHGIDTTNDNTVLASKDSGKVTNDYIKYEGGTINFNDIKYSQAYLDSAKNNMANVGSTKINMLGQLVTGEGTPVTEYTVDDAVKNNNTFLNNVVVKADSNANRLVVGKGDSDETTQYSNGSFAA